MKPGKLTNYRYKYRFCPFCGTELKIMMLNMSEPLRLNCHNCGFIDYQDPKLVVNCIVDFNDKIILLKRAIEPELGKWGFPGGFVDRGETVECAAERETLEECGIKIKIENLLGLYSHPRKIEIIAIYIARYLSGKLSPGEETSEVMLWNPEDIPWDELAFPNVNALALKDYFKKINLSLKSTKLHSFPFKGKVSS